MSVKRVVLTGGPCAGKTSVLSELRDRVRENVQLLVVPEAATLMITAGNVHVPTLVQDSRAYLEFQKSVMLLQRGLSESVSLLVREDDFDECLIVHDRGEFDALAYMNGSEFESVFDSVFPGLSASVVADYYDLVVHLRTPVELGYYTIENNTARTESAVEALECDKRTEQAWASYHSNHHVVEPSEDFSVKVSMVMGLLGREYFE